VPGGTLVRLRYTTWVRRGRAADVQQPPGQLGCGVGTSAEGQPFSQGQRSHGLRPSRHNSGGGEECDIQVYDIYVEPALMQSIQSTCA
jgi:hypothetical protein